MKIVLISTLYPNDKEPKHGIFVRNRLRHLMAHFPDVEAKVVAPVPWFPITMNVGPLAEYSKFVGVSSRETRDGIDVLHPRYLVIPKLGMYLTPFFLKRAMRKAMKQLKREGYQPELIDGHYFYPDGVAIAGVAEENGLPFTVTARGTDINLIPQYPKARRMIQSVIQKADAVMTVCQALMDSLLELADAGHKGRVLRNGVDLDFFTATDESAQQALKADKFGVDKHKTMVVSVGHLIERKGHHLVIEAMASQPDCQLVIAGNGPEETALKALASDLGVADRVTFAGALAQEDLRTLYQAADCLVLASSREGWANVLLESMACGTAVVATNLWGTPEVVASPEAGELVERTVADISDGISRLMSRRPARGETRQYAEQFDWFDTSKGQYEIFTGLLAKRHNASREQ